MLITQLLDVASIFMALPCMAVADMQVKPWMACMGMLISIVVPLYISLTQCSLLLAIFKAVAAHGLVLVTCAAFEHPKCASFMRQISNAYKQAQAAAAEGTPQSLPSPSSSPSSSSARAEAVQRCLSHAKGMLHPALASHLHQAEAAEASDSSLVSKPLRRSGMFSSFFQRGAQGNQDETFASQLLQRGSHPMGGPSYFDAQAPPGEPSTRESSTGEAQQPVPAGSVYQSSFLRRTRVHIKVECGLKPEDLPQEAVADLLSSLHFSTPLLATRAAVREGCIAISLEIVAVGDSGAQEERCKADIVQKLCVRVIGWLNKRPEISRHLVHGTKLDLQVDAQVCKCTWHAPTQEWQHHATITLPAKYTVAATPAVLLPPASMQDFAKIRRRLLPQQSQQQHGPKPTSHSNTCLHVVISKLSPSGVPVAVVGWDGTVPGHGANREGCPNELRLLARLGDQFCDQVQILERRENSDEICLLVQVSLPPFSAECCRLHLELWDQQQLPFPPTLQQQQQQQQQQQLLAQGAQAQPYQARTVAGFVSAPPPNAQDPWAPSSTGGTLPTPTLQPMQLCASAAASCSVMLVQSDDMGGMMRELQAVGPSTVLAPFVADLADFLHEISGGDASSVGRDRAGGCAREPEVMCAMVECGKALLCHALCSGWGHTAQLLLDRLMGPAVGLTWSQVIRTVGDESSRCHSLLFSALRSESAGIVRMVLQWGRKYGGKQWRWDWGCQAAEARCTCLQFVQGLPEGVKEALLADDVEGPVLLVALQRGCGACGLPSAAGDTGIHDQERPHFTPMLLACVKGFDGPFSSCGLHEAAYRQWCFDATAPWVAICCKLVIAFVCLGILKSMFHALTSPRAMSNDVPVLLAYTVPYLCVLLAGPRSRMKKVFLETAKVGHLAVLLLVGLRLVPALLVTHQLHGGPYYFLVGWLTELFFRILHQVQLGALLLECTAKSVIFTFVYSVMGWSRPLLMSVAQNALCLVVGIAFDIWNRSAYLQRSSGKAQDEKFKQAAGSEPAGIKES